MDNDKKSGLIAPAHAHAPAAPSTTVPPVVAPATVAVAPATPAAPAPVASPGLMQINIADLAAIIAQAVKAALPPTAAPADNTAVLAGALTAAIDASKPKPKITIANRTGFNPMNPTNRKRKFRKTFYQNYAEVYVDDVTDEEYELINSPELRPGLYLVDPRTGPLLEILDVKRGSQIGLHIRYSNADINQRMQLESKAPNLVGKLALCITEAKTQSAERKRRREAGEDDED